MSLKSAPYYWVECDDCGVKSTEGGEYTAWDDAGTAEQDALDSEWIQVAGKDYCYECSVHHMPLDDE
jgi:hypothetical protein